MNKFEQLIEYVINDDEQSARDLFHDIVVEKSRQIYEDIMAAEEISDEAADDLIDDIEADEEGLSMEADEDFDDEALTGNNNMDDAGDLDDDMVDIDGIGDTGDMDDESEPATKSDILDLEDKLDELMAEFEQLMTSDEEPEQSEEFGDESEEENNESLEEGVSLNKAVAAKTTEEAGIQTKSPVAANAGAKGAAANPVKASQGQETGRPAPKAQDMGGTTSPKQGPATKPTTSQASGVNTKSPL